MMHSNKGYLALSILMLGLLMGVTTQASADLPQYAMDKHLGVSSCSNSTCHGSIQVWKKSNIRQNEYITWSREDSHSKAYKVLLNKQSRRIARNLGLKQPANESKVCLDCHADDVPESKRGEKFQISDGVGCEACHGGAERWIESHTTKTATHEGNIDRGMYPTEDPVKRAELCYSCHFGDKNKFVTHRIMGAGHPRMSFELDTFTAIQPAHYDIDDDYKKRKKVADGVQVWAIGQAISMRENLKMLMDKKRGRDGMFPELVLFDCYACHHRMSNERWTPRRGTGLPPGIVRLNDANFIMLRHIITAIDPATGKQLRQQTLALHRAVTGSYSAAMSAAGKLLATTEKSIQVIAGHKFSGKDMVAVLNNLIKDGLRGEYQDYPAAEQTVMGVTDVMNVMDNAGFIDTAQFNNMNKVVDKLFDATKNDENYSPAKFTAALRALQKVTPKL